MTNTKKIKAYVNVNRQIINVVHFLNLINNNDLL